MDGIRDDVDMIVDLVYPLEYIGQGQRIDLYEFWPYGTMPRVG